MVKRNLPLIHRRITMAKSNSSRIEAATRQHVGAVLTSQMITDLVKVSDPEWKGGVYPSDCAYKRTEEGLVPRGKTAYGDGVLEFLAENSFKVLPTEEIVRRKPAKAAASTPTPVPVATPVAAPATVAATPAASGKKKTAKKASRSSSDIPVAPKRSGAAGRATV
jgi:hypothetical protein